MQGEKNWAMLKAGACASVMELSVLYPLEYVKIQQQIKPNLSVGDVVRDTWYDGKKDRPKIFGYWRGFRLAWPLQGPRVIVRYMTFDLLRRQFGINKGVKGRKIAKTRIMAMGGVAGAVEALVITTPAEMLKTYYIASPQQFDKPRTLFTHIYNKHGITGYWKGLRATIARQAFSASLRIGLYSHIRWLMTTSTREFPLWKAWLLAGTTTMVGVVLTQPIDTVKTTMQTPAWKYSEKGFFKCYFHIIDTHGKRHLFLNGLFPRLTRSLITAPVTFVMFEFCNSYFW